MAYTDPKPMSQSRVWSIILVVLIHALGLYAMLNGGYEVVKKKLTELEVIDVKEPPPPPKELPPPPPPDTKLPPPPVVPPPLVQTNTPPPPAVIQSTPTPPPVYIAPPVAQPAPPPPPPAPPAVAVKLTPRGSPGSWVTNDDYPPSAQRDGVEGVTGFSLAVGPDGRVTGCSITASSGSSVLDDTACRLLTRRARFNPAKEAGGAAIASSYAGRFRWQIQK
jgi:periplasmic protein TonB